MKIIIDSANRLLNKFGYALEVEKTAHHGKKQIEKQKFRNNAEAIYDAHFRQTEEKVNYLKKKYQEPVFGKITVWELLNRLSQCIDPTDQQLYCVSQLVHTLQVVEAMEEDGIEDEEFIIAGLIHDIGKVLLLTGEAPENIVCANTVIKDYEEGTGLDNCIFQWNHDEFAYDRFKDHVPENIAWLIRYHSISYWQNRKFMNEKDKIYADNYLRKFTKYDVTTKSIYNLPERKLSDYRDLVEHYFPDPVLF